MKYYKYFIISFLIIALDQFVKLWVHFTILPGEAGEIKMIGSWLKLHYILNEGMAFGLKLDTPYGKLILTLFRLIATAAIAYYIVYLVKKDNKTGLAWCVALVLAGALGNVVDSTFYGVFLDNAPKDAITPWFHGKVIDMIYVDIWQGFLPEWLPLIGGSHVALWPIFNIADASIFVGVFFMVIYQNRFFGKKEEVKESTENIENANLENQNPNTNSNTEIQTSL
ncbi:MAG: lipoprotein signal peptidase [Bacteroidetes bacterium]|nr:MAG: lipoprotein signal peptidase [Bacteroidota bacterium]TAG85744.1 MAG: lipoprotein signal peptidase [Bacteroidota bacterium]